MSDESIWIVQFVCIFYLCIGIGIGHFMDTPANRDYEKTIKEIYEEH